MSSAPSLQQKTTPHAVRDDALGAEDVAALLAFTLEHQADFEPTKLGRAGTDTGYRSSCALPRAMFEVWRPRLEACVAELLPGILDEMGMDAFEISRVELQLAAHNDGDFYRRHIDTRMEHEDRRGTRMVSMVYYFHGAPKAFDGGALRIFSPISDSGYDDILPVHNRLVAFPSWVPHEVLPITCPSGQFSDSRFSVNIWARTFRKPPPA